MEQEAKTETLQSNGQNEEVTAVLTKTTSQKEAPVPIQNGDSEEKISIKDEGVVIVQKTEQTPTPDASDEGETEEIEVEESSESEDQEDSTITEKKQNAQSTVESEDNTANETQSNVTTENKGNEKDVIDTAEPAKEEIIADTPIAIEQTDVKHNEEIEKEETNENVENLEANIIDLKKELNSSVIPQITIEKEHEVQKHVTFTHERKQETVNNTIKEIISDIDSNIEEQERVSLLKLEEEKLVKKQQELAQQIQEQTLLAKKLASQNDLMQQKYQQQQQQQQQQQYQKYEQTQPQEQEQPVPIATGSAPRRDPPIVQEERPRIASSITGYLQQQQPPLQQQQPLQQQSPIQQQQYSKQQQQIQQQQTQQLHHRQLQRQDVQQFQTPQSIVTKFSTHEESKDGDTVTKRTETYESKESSNITKNIDLQKIFTPATDAEEILPKNRKLYASSAFYTPGLHPTVEDQVELARRISNSLSDISNQQSKGQSMYVNRKKRSVKWVHEGQAGVTEHEEYCEEQHKENSGMSVACESESKRNPLDKVPLRLLMNPRGQVRDYSSERDSLNVESGLLSPEKCAELVTALQTQKGRGAELFAKRRKKAENWVVDDSNTSTHSPSGLPDNHLHQTPPPKPPTSPSLLPAYSDAGKHRVQLNLHQEQLLEKYAKPGLKVVKSPWEAALETGSASAAFVEETKPQPRSTVTPTPTPSPGLREPEPGYKSSPLSSCYQIPETHQHQAYKPNSYNDHQRDHSYKPNSYNNHQRDLAYMPSLPQGWKAPSVSLPKELYVPKEIPLESYAPPPTVNIRPTATYSPYQSQSQSPQQQQHTWGPTTSPPAPVSSPHAYNFSKSSNEYTNSAVSSSSFPVASRPILKNGTSGGKTYFPISTSLPPKQQYWEPTSYQKSSPTIGGQKLPHKNFNPSPLPYEKLAKFVGSENDETQREFSSPRQQGYLSPISNSRIRNTSPAPFGNKRSPQLSPQQHQNFPYQGGQSSSMTSSMTSSYFSSNDLLHGPTFNNSARGWNSSSGKSSSFYAKSNVPLTSVSNVFPYSDF